MIVKYFIVRVIDRLIKLFLPSTYCLVYISVVCIYLNKNTPGVKKEAAKNLKGLVEIDVKSKWAAKASCF